MADGEQVVIVEPEQRALQHRCERKIVLRQQQEVAERHQVLDGDLLGEADAVGASDGNAARLQRLDHAPARTARAGAPGSARRRPAAVGSRRPASRRSASQPSMVAAMRSARRADRRLPVSRLDCRPQASASGRVLDAASVGHTSTTPAAPRRLRLVADRGRFGGEARGALAIGEHRVDGCQHRLDGAERRASAAPGGTWPAAASPARRTAAPCALNISGAAPWKP